LDFFHGLRLGDFARGNGQKLAAIERPTALWAVGINPAAIPVMRRTRLKKLQLPVPPPRP
jgi:hypothetical protein